MRMVPMSKASSPLVLALLCAAAVSGCAAEPRADGVSVVTSIYPLEYVAERVAGEHASVENLTSPGQEPHDLELSIRQTAELSEADLVVYAPGLQPSVDEAVSTSGPARVIDAADV